ncbi:hypothetical protein RRG08_016261 [Elysia crispata]|uniref:Uncharacterized protein n=1 Tax=Elysia crispata TaxID=231223 RepID=A0AAE1E1P2_9GAST|nr:hypothetical protein RRG08_016261 [Elysia crispata]
MKAKSTSTLPIVTPCVREIYEFISGKKEGVDREEEENLAKITQSLGRSYDHNHRDIEISSAVLAVRDLKVAVTLSFGIQGCCDMPMTHAICTLTSKYVHDS